MLNIIENAEFSPSKHLFTSNVILIKMDLDFYVRVRTCKKRVTGKQP